MNGYEEATKVDKQINELLARHHVSDFPLEYLRFARMIRTTCELIEGVAESHINTAGTLHENTTAKRLMNFRG